MRILLVSDIHANLVALETVLQTAPARDAVWCLGDVVGYGPSPNECCERLREEQALCLAGNHDWAVLGRLPLDEFNDLARAGLVWTRDALGPENRDWLETLSPQRVMPDHDLTLVHGSPREPIWEYITDPLVAAENMAFFKTSACCFGHTHRPLSYHLDVRDHILTPRLLPEQTPFALKAKMLVNPGSVGQPRDGDPRAAYAIVDVTARTLTHYRVEYDIAATQRAMRDARLPERLIARLARGGG